MKLKIIQRKEKECMIGKTGRIRLSKQIIDRFNLKTGSRFIFAYNEEQKKVDRVYLIPTADKYGNKLVETNSSWFITASSIVSSLNLKVPMSIKINEVVESEDFPKGTICIVF